MLEEAKRRRCRESAVCRRLGLSQRSVQNWRKNGLVDGRKGALKQVSHKLSDDERALVVKTACQPRFMNLTPHEIVPILAEEGIYLASESTFYRILRTLRMIKPKRKTRRQAQAIELKAEAPNRLWSWDITYLKSFIRGRFYFLYLIIDVFSRHIMGWEIHEAEDAHAARAFVERVCRSHGIERDALILHSDNGSPMRSGTMLATLQALGVVSLVFPSQRQQRQRLLRVAFQDAQIHGWIPDAVRERRRGRGMDEPIRELVQHRTSSFRNRLRDA